MNSDAFWSLDNHGIELGFMGLNATLRDFSKLGVLFLNKGKFNGKQIISESWIARATTPDKDYLQPGKIYGDWGYQYQWWTLTDSDAYIAIGLQGQYIYIDPATNTVVVKVSYFPPGEQDAENETLAFLRAVSKWQPERRVIN